MYSNTAIYPIYELRSKLLVLLFEVSKPLYKYSFKIFSTAWKKDLKDLQNMEPGTLGKELYYFLSDNNFEVEAKLESHDVGHVLLQFSTDVASEVAMQYFMLGSGKKSVYSLFTAVIGFFILPESHDLFKNAFERGKSCINFQNWDFEHLLGEKVETLRSQIFNLPQQNPLYI